MKSLVLNRKNALFLADKLADLANIIAASLVFGQFLLEEKFSIFIFITGILLTFIFYLIALGYRNLHNR